MTIQHNMASPFEKIPAELKDLNQWVVWKRELRDGKLTKVPYNPDDGQFASVTDPKSWSTFDRASEAFEDGGFHGLGLVFTDDDPYVGIDLDKCRNPETGEIQPGAKEIIDLLASYTEVTQSGGGFHVIAKGTLPGKRRKKAVEGGGAIEMYDKGRYFVMTGDRLDGTLETINERNEQLSQLYATVFGEDGVRNKPKKDRRMDNEKKATPKPRLIPATGTGRVIEDDDELLNQARKATKGEKFIALFDGGDISGHSNDPSAADLALCNTLAYWTRYDAARMDRLFRRSKLFRRKCDEKHGECTYGEITIAKALDSEHNDAEYKLQSQQTPRAFDDQSAEDITTKRISLGIRTPEGLSERVLELGGVESIIVEAMESDSCGDRQAQPFDCRSKTSTA
jgi:primase-polymerase (primpol)-like protein